ncbi:family 10 glycosylhydrolase [Metabacillus indicus]|uniref:glycoside hydrolase family 10 protein n=1 Tax=Metabacillus indicus TaxID=246786 RepID=UPI002A007FFE|nr:family 10 glycosylhydrolase [Metabacillus indicus]MDX8288994.1 family 10 glycosylhydrolase [Metabacillus indicus]
MSKRVKTWIVFAVIAAFVLSYYPSLQPQAAFKENLIKAQNGQTYQISGFNKIREANQLIVYTPEFGDSTLNNQWGIEIIVENDVVTEVRDAGKGADAKIPSDGYVLSGHGEARTWLLANVKLGERTEILYDVISEPRKESTTAFNKLNPQAPFEFPGGRGADELIVYTKDYGYETTGTNQYGAEVIVRNGIVVEMSGSNSPIPDDGFVLSGHGKGKDWLLKYTQVGAKVTFNEENKTVTAVIDASAYINAAELILNKAKASLASAKEQFLDIPEADAEAKIGEAEEVIEEARRAFADENWESTMELSEQAALLSKEAYFYSVESKKVDARGVWHRPVEKNREEIIKTLDRLEAANYNLLFLETYFHGYTIYPSTKAEQNPQFKGWDPLAVFVEEAKKRDIEVHAWVHTFFVGHESLNPPGPVLEKHPEWAAVDRQGDLPSKKEVGYYWLNPAHPEARDFLSIVFNEMTDEYEVEGLHLDYIRYPVSQPYDVGFSYDDYTRGEFKKEAGVDPLEITPASDPENWEKWNKWRERQITTFVERIRGEMNGKDKQVDLSTAVFPEVSDAIDAKFQNWVEWVNAGQLDFITPMVYSVDTNYVERTSRKFIERMTYPVLSYIGLAPFVGFDDELLVSQADAIGNTGAAGQVQFAYHTLQDQHFHALALGPQRTSAIVPHRNPVQSATVALEELSRKMSEIYVAKKGLDPQLSKIIEVQLKQARTKLEKTKKEQALKHIDQAEKLLSTVKMHADPNVKTQIEKQLDDARRYLAQ